MQYVTFGGVPVTDLEQKRVTGIIFFTVRVRTLSHVDVAHWTWPWPSNLGHSVAAGGGSFRAPRCGRTRGLECVRSSRQRSQT